MLTLQEFAFVLVSAAIWHSKQGQEEPKSAEAALSPLEGRLETGQRRG